MGLCDYSEEILALNDREFFQLCGIRYENLNVTPHIEYRWENNPERKQLSVLEQLLKDQKTSLKTKISGYLEYQKAAQCNPELHKMLTPATCGALFQYMFENTSAESRVERSCLQIIKDAAKKMPITMNPKMSAAERMIYFREFFDRVYVQPTIQYPSPRY